MTTAAPRFVAVATVKDEAPYLLEWIAWNRSVGIEHFIMFSNDCSDGTDAMLDRLAELGGLEHHPNPTPIGMDPQHQALRRAYQMPVFLQAEWALHFDADEFLDIATGDGTLSALVAACDGEGGTDAIALPWRYMGSNGAADFEDTPVSQRFVRGSRIWPRETYSANGFKSLFRPGSFHRMGIHKPRATPPAEGLVWRNASGDDITEVFGGANAGDKRGSFTARTLGYAHGTIRHYAVKSRAEFLFKQLRGTAADAYQPNRLAFDYWLNRDINTVAVAPLRSEAFSTILGALEADPVLSELQSRSREHLRQKVAGLMATPANQRFLQTGDTRDTSTQPPGRFLCLGTHHKTGTIWMRRTLRQIANQQEIPFRQFGRLAHMSDLVPEGPQILVHWDADFPRPLYALEEARILHVIRDPRDVLLSGMRYHRVAPHPREKWILEVRDEWGGLNYQDYMNALPDDMARLRFEMDHKHRKTLEEMLAWAYGRSNTFELRYEDLIKDTDCSLFRSALEWANIEGLDIDGGVKAYWNHSLFGGLAEKRNRDDRTALHVQSGEAAQWQAKLPRELAEEYAERFGPALRVLGYAEDDTWVATCQPAWKLGLADRFEKVKQSVGLGT